MPDIEVIGPAGNTFNVKNAEEERNFNDLVRKYTSDNSFVNISDLQDLERIVHFEVMLLRYTNWVSTEMDYDGELVDVRFYSKLITDFSGELRQLKKSIGIDRVTRLKDSEEDVSSYIELLRQRSKEFGVYREEQLTNALTMSHELASKMILRKNCVEEEKKMMGVRDEDIFQWIEEVYMQTMSDIDEHFKKNNQRFWIQEM